MRPKGTRIDNISTPRYIPLHDFLSFLSVILNHMDPTKDASTTRSRPDNPAHRHSSGGGDSDVGGVVARFSFRPTASPVHTLSETIHKRVELSTASQSSCTSTFPEAKSFDHAIPGTDKGDEGEFRRGEGAGGEGAGGEGEDYKIHRRRRNPGELLPPERRRE